ncbi:putative uncharacterized protein DDB_G0292636 [Parasteatoda tepidariorum]|uniref:putative uncharacterized protein DDB_G0292636 n=1 Tax=Parasteatoda tepidariorum TaxID=114398 RepID=UPI00077F8FA9|nr:uncharacterized protein DDB_G0286299 [Parasteatoda tepidariorum]
MRLLLVLSILGVVLLAVSAKKQLEENADIVEEAETKDHSSKKYSKDFQKSHHHGHKHKKNNAQKEQPKEEVKPKSAPVDIPEPEIQLQENIETSKKAVDERKRKEQTEDLHLQDLAYEESLKKDKKKKKGHHGAHQAEVVGKDEKNEQKLFAEQAKNPVEGKVIEDSFEPLKNSEGGKRNRGKDKKSKDKSKNKKAFEKNKDKGKKSKDGKNKNKDKKHKNKDKKKWQ